MPRAPHLLGPFPSVQITLSREMHELLTQPVSAQELANPAPQVYHGGHLIDGGRAKVKTVYLGDNPGLIIPLFDDFAKAVVEGGFYRSPDGKDTSQGTYLPSVHMAWPQGWGTTVTDAQIQTFVDQQVAAGVFPPPDGYSQTMLMFPPGTTVDAFQESSCAYFCGYHSKTSQGNYYTVQNDTSCAGCHGSETPLQASQMVYAHEYGEWRADPDGNGWYVDQAGTFQGWENGDLCAWVAVPYGPSSKGWTVQGLATNDLGCYVGTYTGVVVPGPTTVAMAMSVQPQNAVVGVMSPSWSVKLLDASGAINVLDNSTVVTAVLPGFSANTQTVTAVAGICTFHGLLAQNVHTGLHYNLSAAGLPAISTAPFDVTSNTPPPPPPPTSKVWMITDPAGVIHHLIES